MKKTWIALSVILGGLAVVEILPHFIPGIEAGVLMAQNTQADGKKTCKLARRDQFKTTREEFRGKLEKINDEIKELAASLGDLSPFNLEIRITETRSVNEFLVAIADVISGSKEQLSKAIADEVLPENRRQKASAELVARLTGIESLKAATDKVAVAEAELKKLTEAQGPDKLEVLKKEQEIRRLKMAANIVAAGLLTELPYTDVVGP